MRRVLLGLLFFAWAARPLAMEMELAGETLYLYGPTISDGDWVRYRELTEGKRFSTVVIGNQGGGAVGTALGIAEDLLSRRVTTVVFGYCRSACTYIFLAGERRQVAAGWPVSRTQLAFHGTYERRFGVLSHGSGGASVATYYQSRLPKAGWELMLKALVGLPDRRGFIYIYHPSHRDYASLCAGSVEDRCERIAGTDALSVGVLTSATLADVALPEKFLARESLFGVQVSGFEPLAGAAELAKLCPPERAPVCTASMQRFLERPSERALAVAASGIVGFSWQGTDPRRAAWRALYECVRRAQSLCRVAAVNSLLTLPLYDLWQQQSEDAIRLLRSLGADEAPVERYEQTELAMSGFRTDTFAGPTPETIPGVKEVTTRDVVRMLAGGNAAVLVDVACSETTLPDARCVFGAGLAFARSDLDQAHEKLFAMLLNALSAGKPVVLFSVSAQSWLSANAALRAARIGKSVHWYRGGLAAWRAAGLPTVPAAPVGATVP